jgi:hypothetical protein
MIHTTDDCGPPSGLSVATVAKFLPSSSFLVPSSNVTATAAPFPRPAAPPQRCQRRLAGHQGRAAARAKLAEIDERVAEPLSTRAALSAVLAAECDNILACRCGMVPADGPAAGESACRPRPIQGFGGPAGVARA